MSDIFEQHKALFVNYLKTKKGWKEVESASLDNEKDIKRAIQIAYTTASRTFDFKRTAEERGEKYFDGLIDKASLTQIFKSYFEGKPPQDFNSLHENLCKGIINAFKNECKDGDPTHGQCQKIINVTFKILYCLKGAKDEYFEPCHMILDSYTLNWYHQQCGGKANIIWSKLDPKQYEEIQNNIRKAICTDHVKYFGTSLPETVFKAEFIIWRQEMLRAALKNTLKAFSNIEVTDAVDLKLLKEDYLKEIKINKTPIQKTDVQKVISYLEKIKNSLTC